MKLNWKKTTAVIAMAGAALLIAITATAAFSHGRGRSHGPPQGEGFRRGPGPRGGFGPLRDLNLTDDQKAQIKKITDSFQESDKALFDQLRSLRQSEPDPMSGTFDAVTDCRRVDSRPESTARGKATAVRTRGSATAAAGSAVNDNR